jgi:hypothetical protein
MEAGALQVGCDPQTDRLSRHSTNEPAPFTAVKVTVSPSSKLALQVAGHSIASLVLGERPDVTFPAPLGSTATVSGIVARPGMT